MISQIEGQEFSSRKSAKDAGAKRYFTGKSCPHGHIADRFTSSGGCVECSFKISYSPQSRKLRNKRKRHRRSTDPEFRRKDNEGRLASYHKKVSTKEGRKKNQEKNNQYWHQIHKKRINQRLENDEAFAETTREKARELAKRRRERPGVKEQERNSSRKYRQENRAKYRYHKAMRRARTYQATPPWLTNRHKKQIRELYEERQKRSEEEEGVEYHVDHIIPLAFYDNVCGLHVPWNLQLLKEDEHRKKTHKYEQSIKRKDFKTGKMVALYTD